MVYGVSNAYHGAGQRRARWQPYAGAVEHVARREREVFPGALGFDERLKEVRSLPKDKRRRILRELAVDEGIVDEKELQESFERILEKHRKAFEELARR